MSQTNTTTRTEFVGDAADNSPYTGGFPLRTTTDVEIIYVTDATGAEVVKTIVTDYTISVSDDFSGFTVTLVTTAPAVGETLLIRLNAALTHIPDYENFNGNPSATFDNDHDKATQQSLSNREILDRTIRVSKGQPDADLPIAALTLKGNADSYIAVNTAEDGFKFVVDETAATNIGGTGTADVMTKFTAEQTIGNASMTEAEAQDTVDITLQDEVIVSGGVVTHNTGLIYDVSPCIYYIDGVRYTTIAGTATIGTEHATLDRIDTVVVNTSSAIAVVAGTPAANPVEPSLDQSTQIKLANITVTNTAGGGGTGVTTDLIYDENVGAADEWTTSAVASTYDVASTDGTPQSGTKSIKGTTVVANDSFLLTSDGQLALTDFPTFSFYIKVISWPVLNVSPTNTGDGGSLEIRWSDGTDTSIWTKVVKHTFDDFDETDTTNWQKISLAMSAFGITSTTILTMELRKRGSATTPSFFLDNFVLESTGQGQNTGSVSGSGTTNRISRFRNATTIEDGSLFDDSSTVTSDVPIAVPSAQANTNVALQPAGDPDTGINFSAPNALELVTNATAALSIDSSQVVTAVGNVAVGGDLAVTGAILAADGTVSAPGISFGTDPDSGLYIKGANNVAIAANGVEIMAWGNTEIVGNDPGNVMNWRIETSGNANTWFVDGTNDRVGILNGSPAVALDVTGAISASGTVTASAGAITGIAGLNISDADADTTERAWQIGTLTTSEVLHIATLADGFTAGNPIMTFGRVGIVAGDVTIPTSDLIITAGDLTVTAGTASVGIAAGDGNFHSHASSVGSITANTQADVGVFEATTHSGITILGGTTSNIFFGTGSTNIEAFARYTAATDVMDVGTSIAGGTLELKTASQVTALSIDASQDITMVSLAGTGSRTVVADANGKLSAP